jgi:hypothetical protein
MTSQFIHVMLLEHILHQSVVFAQMQSSTFASDDTCSILASMLEDSKSVKEHLVNLQDEG